jgi:hypothetical protein
VTPWYTLFHPDICSKKSTFYSLFTPSYPCNPNEKIHYPLHEYWWLIVRRGVFCGVCWWLNPLDAFRHLYFQFYFSWNTFLLALQLGSSFVIPFCSWIPPSGVLSMFHLSTFWVFLIPSFNHFKNRLLQDQTHISTCKTRQDLRILQSSATNQLKTASREHFAPYLYLLLTVISTTKQQPHIQMLQVWLSRMLWPLVNQFELKNWVSVGD